MAQFDDSDVTSLKSNVPSAEVVSRELPKLVVAPGQEGVPNLTVNRHPQYRYTKEETAQHPLADRADAILPPKYKGDHTFDPTTRVFEPANFKNDPFNEKAVSAEQPQNINAASKTHDSAKDSSSFLQMPERSLFGGGSSGGDSSLKGPDVSAQKSLSSLFEPSRPRGGNESSLFVIIIASLAVILSAILKLLTQIFWPWVNRMNSRRRRFRFSRR